MLAEEYKESFCPHCKQVHKMQVLDQPIDLDVKGTVVMFDQRTLLCDVVFEDCMPADEVTRNLQRAVHAFEMRNRNLEQLRRFDSFGLVELKDLNTNEIFMIEQAVWRYVEHKSVVMNQISA